MSNQPSQPVQPHSAITVEQRRRLQREFFEPAMRLIDERRFDDANRLLPVCVIEDPGNTVYVQTFLANLSNVGPARRIARWPLNRRIAKAVRREDWSGVLELGPVALALGLPNDRAILAVAQACFQYELDASTLCYLGHLSDNPDGWRLAARCHTRLAQLDCAADVWRRLLDRFPDDAEATESLAWLSNGKSSCATEATPIPELSGNLDDLLTRAESCVKAALFDEAQATLDRAASISGSDMRVHERMEDLQVQRIRHHLAVAEQRAERQQTDESWRLVRQLEADADRTELQMLAVRSERYPEDAEVRFNLGRCLKRLGNFRQALACFEELAHDSRPAPELLLESAACRQHLRQFGPALQDYRAAIDGCGDGGTELLVTALERAARLAEAMGEREFSQQCVQRLGQLK